MMTLLLIPLVDGQVLVMASRWDIDPGRFGCVKPPVPASKGVHCRASLNFDSNESLAPVVAPVEVFSASLLPNSSSVSDIEG